VTFLDHFLAELIPTALISVVVWSAFATCVLTAFLAGVGVGRRSVWRSLADRRAGWDAQMQLTVPMLSAAAKEESR
jgi:hypothetical protein